MATPASERELATTIYDRILKIATEMGHPGVVLCPGISSHGALIGDISNAVVEEAKRRYPLQEYSKVVAVRENNYPIRARLYPVFMCEAFIDELIRDFVRTKRPFASNGAVIYDRPVVSKEEKQRMFQEKLRLKYGAPLESREGQPEDKPELQTEHLTLEAADERRLRVVLTKKVSGAPRISSPLPPGAPDVRSNCQFPGLPRRHKHS